MIRCKRCNRIFSNYADHCPDCHRRSKRGWVKFIVPILSVAIAVGAIVLTLLAVKARS
jgi:RNA polymerase subunit RPABC4/transcription elongation factor Spt4